MAEDELKNNLPALQNLIKRDPASYYENFKQQYCHFENDVQRIKNSPEQLNKQLMKRFMFMAEVAHCYQTDLKDYPQLIMDLLRSHNTVLIKEMRMTLCKALILLKSKNFIETIDLLKLFFELLRCQDKTLRSFLESQIINDIQRINKKHKNAQINKKLQNFMFTMLKDDNVRAAHMSLAIMTELYRKNIWNDERTVNVIATGCFSKSKKVMVPALKFFLGKDTEEKDSDNSDSENEVDVKEVALANKVNKKTRKRDKQLNKVKKLASKAYKKKSKAPTFNFSAIHLIHDPQGMAEKLFKQLEATTIQFEIKLLTLDVISRLIGLHDLFLFNFYPYIQKYMQPHQREVTRILQFAAQASHELVPPDVIEPVLKTLANNFITERNSSDGIAIGLNAVREICSRCPLSINKDLLQDLAQYKVYKDRSVMMAARSLISLFRNIRPDLLHKKDRGRPNEASEEIDQIEYGKVAAKEYIPGAEVLLSEEKTHVEIDSESESASDDEKWIDISHSEGEATDNDEKSSDEDQENAGEKKALKANQGKEMANLKKEQAQSVTLNRILTDEDFKRIEAENLRKQVVPLRKGAKRKLDEQIFEARSELVKLGDIENIYKKRKHDKQTRIESVKRGQEDREKFGYKDGRANENCSKTNREKKKNKNFQMIKHKVHKKTKRSFKDKQIALRNHLLKLKKMK